MASGTLHKPGSELGPCLDPCNHCDCRQKRVMALVWTCDICRAPLGYDRPFYMITDDPSGSGNEYVHASCFDLEHAGPMTDL